jgi:hypothetical protein
MEGFQFNELEWLPYNMDYIDKCVPDQRGVYFLSCPKGHVIYVGKASRSSVRTRLITYGRPDCHNKWIRLYFRGKNVAWFSGAQPAGLYFAYWLTNHPDLWEAIAIQNSCLASGGLNQRNEWAPLFHTTDRSYQVIVRIILDRLAGEERRRFEAWLRSQ